MIKLMKYEFRKTLFVKLIVLGAMALAEIAFLVGLWGDKERTLSLSILLLTFIALGGIMIIGLASVVILHRDVSTRQSYMLFMTPNSSTTILGAKLLENGLSIVMAGACFFALGALDITLLFAKMGQLEDLWKMIMSFLHSINQEITLDLPVMLSLMISILGNWISTVTAMYLGVVVANALLNGKRFSGFLSFIIIVILLWAVSWVQMQAADIKAPIQTVFLIDAGIALLASLVMYIVTAQIMERKLSV
ncbi:MAG: hypothetical protein K6A68_07575 [Clostridiales bacterium]|nr:hypothetical protein [Clostridiales bacterium]